MARRRLEASLARRRALGEGREISSSLCTLAELALAEGNPGETEGRARSCLAESRERGKGSEIPRAGALLAESLVGLGRVEEAERVADNTILSAADSAMIVSRVAAVRVRALLAAARGQRERAIQELESLLESDLAGGPPRIRREISRSLRSL